MPPLIQDFLNQKEAIKPFTNFNSKSEYDNVNEAVNACSVYEIDRTVLVNVLNEQAEQVNNTHQKSIENINLLKNENTFTITTGHQLCLFTGPLYFITKIISTINYAEKLSKQDPIKKFIPVYWMASEDHDFEEINHFTIFNNKLKWESKQSGAVGNFKTDELASVLNELKKLLGSNTNATFLCQLFEDAYIKHQTLAQATRYIVNELFGKYGLIIIDGNHNKLKKIFIEYFKNDLFKQSANKQILESIAKLNQLGYKAQVNPREVNLFFLEENSRKRIEKNINGFKVIDSSKTFSTNEITQLIETQPECFSPNVVLRPLYQQVILPNIAYFGGPGEISYWLELKHFFENENIFFPILMLRDFIFIVDDNTNKKINKFSLSLESLFEKEDFLISNFIKQSNSNYSLESEAEQIKTIFSEIEIKLEAVDKSLQKSVEAECAKTLNSLKQIEAKVTKSLKNKSEVEISQLKQIFQKTFPGGIPNERVLNFSQIYLNHGNSFIPFLKDNIVPSINNQIHFLFI